MRATGASAGGATALANAALRSKKGVAASIEQQEKSNEDKRAAGEQTAQNKKQQEQQRMQTADVAGRQFVFNQTENREMQQLNRVAGQLGAAQQAVSQANSDATAATLGMIGGITSSISSAASAYKA
jgi:predicted kinase